MESESAPSFGRSLWDQSDQIENYTKHGTQILLSFSDFLKRRAEIEKEYAAKLQKLVKTQQEEHDKRSKSFNTSNSSGSTTGGGGGFAVAVSGTTANAGWMMLLGMADHAASYHAGLADQLVGEVRRKVKEKVKENEKMFKKSFDEVRKEYAEYKKVTDHLERIRQKYDKATKDMDMARQAYEQASADMNRTAKEIEKLRHDAEKKAIIAQEAAGAYKSCIEATNTEKDRFYGTTLPRMLDQIQRDDESHRIEFLKKAFLQYNDLLAPQSTHLASGVQSMSDMFTKISHTYDSASFAKLMCTHSPLPSDFTFEERSLGIAHQGSAGLLGRKTVTRGFTKTKDDIEENKEDAIITMPSKQGRKKALERIKVLDKELTELEKKRQGVDTLMNVYASKPEINQDPKVKRDLDDQIAALEARTHSVVGKKYKLQCYIATIDGSPMPDPPATMAGGHGGGAVAVSSSPITPFSDTSSVTSPAYHSQSFRQDEADFTPSPSSAPPPPPPPAPLLMDESPGIKHPAMRMAYDFTGGDSHELSVAAGEMVEILEKQDDGWWKARVVRDGEVKEGFIPGNYTEPDGDT